MKLTKEQKDQAIKDLSFPYGYVKLVCDGYQVTLSVERCKGMTYRVMTYVNGHFKGLWCDPTNECPESKFMRKSITPACSPSRKREVEKVLGKRYVKNNPYYSKTITHYMPDWASGKTAINHMCKVSESIQIAEKS